MNKINVILADDHVVVRQGLHILIDQQKDMQVVGEAGDGLQLLDLAERLHPDVVVIDLKMPTLNGLDAADEIRSRFPNTHAVILTMHADRSYLERALQAGVCGYVLKEENITEMCTAIRHAAKGERYISERMSPLFQNHKDETPSHLLKKLTHRERQVFQLVVTGKTNGEIATLMGISVRTVEGHRAHMMTKLDLKTHVELAHFALRNGIFLEK